MTSPVRAPRPTPRRGPVAPPPPRGAHLRVVDPPSRRAARAERRRPAGAVFVVATALVFGSLLTAAVLHGMLASGQANLDQLDTDLQTERTALAQAKLELANLQSPQRIATEAEAMGMRPADRQHWVSAADGETTVVERTPDDAVEQEVVEPDDPAATSELASTDATTDATTDEGGTTE